MNKHILLFLEIIFVIYILGAFFSIVLLQVAAVSFIITGIILLIYDPKLYKPTLFSVLITAFVLSAVISIFMSPQPARALPVLMHQVVLWSVLPVTILFRHSKRFSINRLGFAILVLGSLSALAGIFHHFMGVERTYGFTGGYFTLAALIVFTMPVSLGKAQQEMGTKLGIYVLLILLQLGALWWTYTRTAFGAIIFTFLAAVFFYSWRNRDDITHDVWFAGAMYVIPVVLLLVLMLNSSDPRINPVYEPILTDTTSVDLSSGRSSIYQDGVNIIGNAFRKGEWGHLLFGFGLGSRKILLESGYHSWESDYLEAFINQGIIGVALLLAIYVMFLVKIARISLSANNFLWFGFAQSGLAFWLMSFLTIQLQGIYSATSFAIIYAALSAWKESSSGPFWNTTIKELMERISREIKIDWDPRL